MSQSSAAIYVKPEKNTQVSTERVSLSQVADVFCQEKETENRCKAITLVHFHEKKPKTVVCSAMEVIRQIQKLYPQAQITNLGEMDFLISYRPEAKRIGWVEHLKAAGVCLIVFFGAAFAIMTFNNDGNVSDIFQKLYLLFTGETPSGTTALEYGYSIGLGIGVIVFFNHFGKRKLSTDPTPIEVQMRLYEDEVNTTLIQNAARKEKDLDQDAPETIKCS